MVEKWNIIYLIVPELRFWQSRNHLIWNWKPLTLNYVFVALGIITINFTNGRNNWIFPIMLLNGENIIRNF